jgi:DNA end-binding protein Ku
MPKRSTKKAKPAARRRASWKGSLSFGLVSFEVEAFNALNREESDIRFNQLHAKCHQRIRYQKVCPTHGELTNDEIVSGYEVTKGHYVEIDPDELDELRTPSERALRIDGFVAPDAIDPLYYDGRMYYLVPSGKTAQTPYSVIVTAMEREKVYGIGEVVFSGKDQVVLIRVVDRVLHMAMLNYAAEMHSPDPIASSAASTAQTRQIKLAQTLIREWSVDELDFSKYTDSYRQRVEKLIAAKSKGRKVAAPKEEEEAPATINLMEALKRSLDERGPQTKPSLSRAKPKPSSRSAKSPARRRG